MAYIPCVVDTRPMAEQIGGVSANIQNTTSAVVTMHSAVIAAEAASAKNICANVNRGFFTMITSQISQKIASKKSRVEALLMQMAHQKRRLMNIRKNMERDYNRIVARYVQIFTNINNELEKRIKQTDQPVFETVDKYIGSTANRMNSIAATFVTSQAESITSGQQILVSNIKENTRKTMGQFSEFLSISENQKILTDRILISDLEENGNAVYNIPVMMLVKTTNSNGDKEAVVFLPTGMEHVSGDIEKWLNDDRNKWKNESLNQDVIREFEKLVNDSEIIPKVRDKMMMLLQKSETQTL